jgi:transcriptional regulator with XRE-family HTH domain
MEFLSIKESSMSIGIAIRAARVKSGMSQRQVANRARMTRTSISAIENGRREPDIETLNRIGSAIGIDDWRILRFYRKHEVSPIVTAAVCAINPEQRM